MMNSWSFRGAVFEYVFTKEDNNLIPYNLEEITENTTNWRQNYSLRTSLYNNFFNASDKTFADANSNWALSADVTSSRIFIAYYWGVFFPASEKARWGKIGVGPAIVNINFSYTLKLCSEYKVTPFFNPRPDGTQGHKGECVGEKRIDSSSINYYGLGRALHMTFFERVTKDSIWRVLSLDFVDIEFSTPLKNHSNLDVYITNTSADVISYTYRF